MKPQVFTMMTSAPSTSRRDLGTVSHERGHHPLGVHRVLVTSERDQSDARAVIGTGQAYLVIDRFDIWVHVRANGIRGQRKDGKIPGPQPSLARGLRPSINALHRVMIWTPGGGVNWNELGASRGFRSNSANATSRTLPFSSSISTRRISQTPLVDPDPSFPVRGRLRWKESDLVSPCAIEHFPSRICWIVLRPGIREELAVKVEAARLTRCHGRADHLFGIRARKVDPEPISVGHDEVSRRDR